MGSKSRKNRQKKRQNQSQEVDRQPSKEVVREAQQLISQQYSGPIPPSLEMKRYEEVAPGSAKSIIKMSQNALRTESRHVMIKDVTELISVIMARGFLYFLVVVAYLLITNDKDVEGLLTGLPAIVAIIYNNVRGKNG